VAALREVFASDPEYVTGHATASDGDWPTEQQHLFRCDRLMPNRTFFAVSSVIT